MIWKLECAAPKKAELGAHSGVSYVRARSQVGLISSPSLAEQNLAEQNHRTHTAVGKRF